MKGFEGGLKAPRTRFETFGRLLSALNVAAQVHQHVQVTRKMQQKGLKRLNPRSEMAGPARRGPTRFSTSQMRKMRPARGSQWDEVAFFGA
jgi:hypothetical protein